MDKLFELLKLLINKGLGEIVALALLTFLIYSLESKRVKIEGSEFLTMQNLILIIASILVVIKFFIKVL